MKILQSSIFRAIISIIVGVLLIKYRDETVTWITIAIGVLFFLSGVISLTTFYGAKKNYEKLSNVTVTDANGNMITGEKPNFPIVGLGSLILGVILALMPNTFVTGLMYILAAILILGAINQFVNLATATKFAHVGFFFWIMPSLILLVGLIAVIHPSTIATAPLFVIGWCMLLYGVVECINALKIHACKKNFEKATSVDTDASATVETESLENKEEKQE